MPFDDVVLFLLLFLHLNNFENCCLRLDQLYFLPFCHHYLSSRGSDFEFVGLWVRFVRFVRFYFLVVVRMGSKMVIQWYY